MLVIVERKTEADDFPIELRFRLGILILLFTYSELSNKRTLSNKSIQACNFGLLLHKIARIWPFLA